MNTTETLMYITAIILISISLVLVIQIIWWYVSQLDNKNILFIKKIIRKIQVFYVFKLMTKDEYIKWKYKRRTEIINRMCYKKYIRQNRENWNRLNRINTIRNKYNNKFFKGSKMYE